MGTAFQWPTRRCVKSVALVEEKATGEPMRACGSLCVSLWERRAAGRTVDQGLACGMQASGKDDGGYGLDGLDGLLVWLPGGAW